AGHRLRGGPRRAGPPADRARRPAPGRAGRRPGPAPRGRRAPPGRHRPAADPGVGAAGASPTRCASGPARGSGAGRVVPRYAPRGVRVRGTSVGLGQTLLAGALTRAVARTGLAVAALRARPGVLARLPAGTGVLAARLVAAARAEGGADRGQGRGDRLEEGLPAVGAVAAATGGQADGQSVAGEHGAAAVAGLCAH